INLIHSLDSISVAEEINKRAERIETNVSVLFEVNISKEGAKGGISPEQVEDFLVEIKGFPHIDVKGFMTMPPFFDKPEMARPYFRCLRELRDEFQGRFPNIQELSMGMSGD